MKTSRPIKGFTLIELMIAIAILAIIMGIAIPSYTQYVLKSGRAEAKTELYQGAQALERCYTRYNAYNDGDCAAATALDGRMSDNEKYELGVTEISATAFKLTATPKGSQAKDTDCTSFALTHTGQKEANGDTDAAVIDECW